MQPQSPTPNPTTAGTAIPFILHSDKGFHIPPQTCSFLRSLHTPVGVLCVVGKYRTGKSLFINRVLLNSRNAFRVGPTVNPCTKGLWLWKQPLPSENPDHPNSHVLVIDSQGFGGTDQSSNHDSRILLFAMLLSSFFIYNSVGSIDENSLNSLNVIINLAKEIQAKTGEDADGYLYFPSFLWVVRDFSLQMVDREGCPMAAKEYLEKALEIQKGVSDAIENKNKLRRLFKHFFKDRDCATLIRPVQSQHHLQNLDSLDQSQLRPEFTQQIKSLRKRIFRRLKPKTIHQKPLTGAMLFQLATAYIQAVNSGGLPSIHSVWSYVRRKESAKAEQLALQSMEGRINGMEEKVEEGRLKDIRKEIEEKVLEEFGRNAVGSEEELREQVLGIKQRVKRRVKEFKQENRRRWGKYYQQYWNQISSEFMHNLQTQSIKSVSQYRKSLALLKDQFLSKSQQGPGRLSHLQSLQLSLLHSHLYPLLLSTQSKLLKDLQFSSLKSQHLQSQLKQQRQHSKQLEQKQWQLQRKLSEKQQELLSFEGKMEQAVLNVKAENQRLQAEVVSKKGTEERLMRESEYLRKVMEDGKLRVENLTARLTESEIARKQLGEENRNTQRELESANQKVANRQQDIARLTKDLIKSQQSIDKQRLKQAKLTNALNQLKAQSQHRHLQLQSSINQLTHLQKQLQLSTSKQLQLQRQLKQLKSRVDEDMKSHFLTVEALKQNIDKEVSSKMELVETNKNLSSAVARMEMRTKQAEEKIEGLKEYKNAIKNASCLQCRHCNKFIACAIFTQHLNICTHHQQQHQSTIPNPTSFNQLNHKLPTTTTTTPPLQLSITQTLVRQSDSKPYTQYVISLSKGPQKWQITRKYKSFCELHNSLRIALPGVHLSDAAYVVNPQQGSRKSLLIEERRKMLEKYLRDISQNQMVVKEQVYMAFMELPKENQEVMVGGLLPQSPEEFLRGWNQRNTRMKETSGSNNNRRLFSSHNRG